MLCGRWLKALRVGAVLPAIKPSANIGEEDLTDAPAYAKGRRELRWCPPYKLDTSTTKKERRTAFVPRIMEFHRLIG